MSEARYIYCVIDNCEKKTLGNIGLENKKVYPISYKDIGVLVHDCLPQPYQSENQETVKSWLLSHERVVEKAWKKFKTVLPLSFDTIVKPDKENSAEENIRIWLRNEYKDMKQKLSQFKGKAEFGVQVFWYPKLVADRLMDSHQELQSMNKEIQSKPIGTAYLYKQKLDQKIRTHMVEESKKCFKAFYEKIKVKVEDIKVEKIKRPENEKQMLMNLTCLLHREKSKELGDELEKIDEEREFSVRFTGPWPPYSFVS